jgi:hypothetical protein
MVSCASISSARSRSTFLADAFKTVFNHRAGPSPAEPRPGSGPREFQPDPAAGPGDDGEGADAG